jgi:NhaA family Na+:H+ antiporter
VVGKPVGIMLFAFLAVRLGAAQLPVGVTWRTLLGAGCLGGIGFTMSLFIGSLALDGPLLDAAKIGILVGSTVSALLGLILLLAFLPAAERVATAIGPSQQSAPVARKAAVECSQTNLPPARSLPCPGTNND